MTSNVLPRAALDLCFADLRVDDAATHAHAATLSPTEIARAERFHFADDRRRFVNARGLLRAELSRRIGIAPHALAFVEGPYGKPMLAGCHRVQFSASRAGDLAAIAFLETAVGIDVVAEANGDRLLRALDGFCSPDERTAVARLEPPSQREALLVIWARKEALLKATGEGLTRSPATVTVWAGDHAAPRGTVIRHVGRDWMVRDIAAASSHRAAVAHEVA
jgi:4'-phosphopantetheinyl transferase